MLRHDGASPGDCPFAILCHPIQQNVLTFPSDAALWIPPKTQYRCPGPVTSSFGSLPPRVSISAYQPFQHTTCATFKPLGIAESDSPSS